jgi:hypothetical protein
MKMRVKSSGRSPQNAGSIERCLQNAGFKRFPRYAGLIAGIFIIFSQNIAGAQELSVEDSYLQQSVEMTILREQAQTNDRESKLLALEYARQMIENGETGDALRQVLQGLALEGTLNKVREEGRTSNNFPDIRMKAAQYLGSIDSKESVNALVKIILIDPEPSVITEAVHSLEKIGLNDNDETINAIAYAFTRADAKLPNNVLALSVVDALAAFAEKGETKNPEIYKTLLYISTNGFYVKTVRDYAAQKLSKLYKVGTK